MAEKDCSARIVAAARKRFQHFGYGKTSMAEIAADCGMSPGNIYRFFPGKLDIAEAIASDDYKAHLERLTKLATRPDRNVREKLRDLLVEGLRRTYARLEKDPRALELARVLAAERPDFSDWMAGCERKLMVDLMEEARTARRIFGDRQDCHRRGHPVRNAEIPRPPALVAAPLAGLERELDGVLTLLLEGLGAPRALSPA